MDFALSAQAEDVRGRTWDFTREFISPAEPVWDALRAARGHDDRGTPPLQEGTLRSAFEDRAGRGQLRRPQHEDLDRPGRQRLRR